MTSQTIKKLKITTLVEDTSPKRSFWGEHGLSFWIEADNKKILFDTGQSGEVLLHNLRASKLDLRDLDAFVLSHSHDDHSGGIKLIVDQIKNIPMYCASGAFEEHIPDGKRVSKLISDINYARENLEIFPGIYIPQERKTINSPVPTKEINMVINLERKGIVIIVGCAHHGLVNIINDAMSIFKGRIPVYAILGGLHLKDSNKEEIINIVSFLKDSGLKILAPNHCTGSGALRIMAQAFPQEMKLVINTDTGSFHTGRTIQL